MRDQPEPIPFIIRLSDGRQIVLRYGYPRERQLEYNERLGSAAESDIAQLFGDGTRKPTPMDLDHYIYGESRHHAARLVGEFETDLRLAQAIEFGDLTLPLLRARVVIRSPITGGFKLTTRLFSAQHEFTDGNGLPVPLA